MRALPYERAPPVPCLFLTAPFSVPVLIAHCTRSIIQSIEPFIT